jgi:hypothetical protein
MGSGEPRHFSQRRYPLSYYSRMDWMLWILGGEEVSVGPVSTTSVALHLPFQEKKSAKNSFDTTPTVYSRPFMRSNAV